jgi:hypothetical protein
MNSGVNHFNRQVGLSEFHDTVPPVILYFGGDIGDRSMCVEISLICSCHCQFLLLRLLVITYICILMKALS